MNCRRCKKLIDSNDMFCKHCGAAISVDDIVSDNADMLIYEESAEGITIVGFNRERMIKGTAIIIPNYINGKSVTKIGNMAFRDCCDIISITIPDSVREIESAAFAGCCSLYHVVLPSNLKVISDSIFNRCVSLFRIEIPEEVEKIGNFAFAYCTALSYIYLPKLVSSINGSAFSHCDSLTKICISPENNDFVIEDDIMFNKEKTVIIACCKKADQFIIPKNVRVIGEFAFCSCKIEKIFLNHDIDEIGSYAFYDSKITSISVKGNVRRIGERVFSCSKELFDAFKLGSIEKLALECLKIVKECFKQYCQKVLLI